MIYANIFTMFRIKILFCVSDKERDESSLTKLHFLISLPLPSFQSSWSEEGCHVTLLLIKFWKVLGSVQSATDAPAFTVLLQL